MHSGGQNLSAAVPQAEEASRPQPNALLHEPAASGVGVEAHDRPPDRAARLDDIRGQHESQAADVADEVELVLEIDEPGPQLRAALGRIRHVLAALEQSRASPACGPTRDRVAAEGARMAPRRPVHDVGPGDDGA